MEREEQLDDTWAQEDEGEGKSVQLVQEVADKDQEEASLDQDDG